MGHFLGHTVTMHLFTQILIQNFVSPLVIFCCLADIRKSIASKKKNVHQFTAGALKTTDRKVGEMWKKQKKDRLVSFRVIFERNGRLID